MKKDFLTVTPDSGSGNATVTVVASENIGGARSTSIKISGGGMSRTINTSQQEGGFAPSTAPNGVYIQHSNGRLFLRSEWNIAWNSKAVGVAVKTAKCSFVIAPVEQTAIQWGGYGTLISGCTNAADLATAKKDYKGKQNTDAIITQLGASTQYAAIYCRNYTFKNGKKGYLPALGELYEAYLNKSEVDACMSLIGGKALYDSSISNYVKWSSTQYDKYDAWELDWNDGNVLNLIKRNPRINNCARPFAALI